MLSLSKLANLCGIEEKGIFPYKVLNTELKEIMRINNSMFNTEEEYVKFILTYGENVNIFTILEQYCKNDALITKKSIIKFWQIIEENGLTNNNKILTAAKLSVENYFKYNKIVKKKINIQFDRTLRAGYYGGRTEVFGNLYEDEIALHFDWSGMYAQCMKEKILGGEVYKSNIVNNFYSPGFYWIKFRQELEYPVLPIKKNKLLFANGEFEGWYWFEEIILAKSLGVEILNVDKVIGAQYYDNFLSDFIDINNKIREKGGLYKQIGKNNNNAFYGRLGMDPERMEEELSDEIINNDKYIKYEYVNGIYINYSIKEKSISNLTVSASITAKARIRLYKGMLEVNKSGGRLLYTDTDSIIAAYKKNTYTESLDKSFGEVFFDSKKEDTIITDAVFAMPKTYALKYLNNKEIVKIKGFNVTPSFKEFKENFYLKKDIITINNEWSKKDFVITQIKKEKKTNLFSLDKRIWSADLKNTSALSLSHIVNQNKKYDSNVYNK